MSDRIKAAVFDVGRVIVQWDLRCLFAKLIDETAELDWFLANVVTEEWHFQHDAGRPLAEMVPERKALFPDHAELIDAYKARFLETIPGLVPGTADVIRRLADRQVPLFAITNFGSEFWQQFFPTEPLLGHFSDIVVSGVEKLAKPDPAIFMLAEKRFGYRADEMIFIDDNAANIVAADSLGWHTHLFVDAGTLEAELARYGLLP